MSEFLAMPFLSVIQSFAFGVALSGAVVSAVSLAVVWLFRRRSERLRYGILFGAIHSNHASLIPLSLLGMVFAAAYHRTGSLAVPVIMHSLFNCVSFLVLTYGPPLTQ